MGLRRCSFGVRGSGLLEGSIGIRLGLLSRLLTFLDLLHILEPASACRQLPLPLTGCDGGIENNSVEPQR